MTVIVEDGSGVAGANSYVSPAFVTAYLTDRNRQTESGWTAPESTGESAACVAATDYIERRFGQRFRGQRQYRDISTAKGTWSATAQPGNTQVVTLGTVAYRFVTSLSSANDVLIGSSLAASIENLLAAIAGTAGNHNATGPNADATAYQFYGDRIVAYANAAGTAGNAVVSTTTVTGASWNSATLRGGSNLPTPQPLAFPRAYLYERDGVAVLGVPALLMQATAEYAVRARDGALVADPTVSATGGEIIGDRVTVGPITLDTSFSPTGSSSAISEPYPEADRMLAAYLGSGMAVMR